MIKKISQIIFTYQFFLKMMMVRTHEGNILLSLLLYHILTKDIKQVMFCDSNQDKYPKMLDSSVQTFQTQDGM